MILIFFTIIVPLIAGGLVYIGWRPDTLLMFPWFEFLGIKSEIYYIREFLSQFHLPEWVVFWLPNGTWTFAFTAALSFIWLDLENHRKFFWILIPLSLGITMEIGQFLNILPGTFCFGDILAHSFGAVTALLLINFIFYKEVKEN